ncbi:DNA/RNA-binding protein KIN17 isoform X1 [Hydra vulgaris]|uniref:DNA/RNA-binding protein KIN17 isoform X1 n=1 Tax=Hydra vulgaris TaxID=6087 RepID=UPI001F5FD22B|nr:DNA/RNA-binding protein KIN17 [Hydra vulgaris]
MGKEKPGFLTPKAISNRIKSKGLQKLRWYCQMCQKQCRDENGFKCHCMSESHQRQLLLFAENPHKYLDSFSKEFFDDFIYLLSRRFGTKRVHCNIVYQEYVAERNHTHMNATQWETLTDFVKWLGREGHCVVDETPKGWFITYIDKDPEVIARQKAAEAKVKKELDDQERIAKFVEKQVERAKETLGEPTEATFTELKRSDEEEKVQFSFCKPGSSTSDKVVRPIDIPKLAAKLPIKQESIKVFKEKPVKRKSALEEIVEEEKKKLAKKTAIRKENWLTEGIVVKIITKKLGDKYYKKKGVIKEVKNLFIAFIQLDSGDTLKLDQTHLETVIPAIGKEVKIVNGLHQGCTATMLGINQEKFSATLQLKDGPLKGSTIEDVKYEDFCKLATT